MADIEAKPFIGFPGMSRKNPKALVTSSDRTPNPVEIMSGDLLLVKVHNVSGFAINVNIASTVRNTKVIKDLLADVTMPLPMNANEQSWVLLTFKSAQKDVPSCWTFGWSDLAEARGRADPAKLEFQVFSNSAALSFLGDWKVNIGDWQGIFHFDASHDVYWKNLDSQQRTMGRWALNLAQLPHTLHWSFGDGDIRTFVALAVLLSGGSLDGDVYPAGQSPYHMEKL